MFYYRLIFILAIYIAMSNLAPAQGCSDAGICTINGLQTDKSSTKENILRTGISYGVADNSVFVINNTLEYKRTITSELNLNIKLSSLYQSGNDISVFGLSDIYLNADYNFTENMSLTGGLKIPLSDGNRLRDGASLPMDYQSSLGTFDIIAGITYVYKDISLAFAYQQSLTDNKNTFTGFQDTNNQDLQNFHPTNSFKRSGDVMLRVSYLIAIDDSYSITLSLLPIYHIAKDSYKTLEGIETDIDGSAGLTLNSNMFLDLMIDNSNTIRFIAAMPFIVRDKRPDGLTRSFIGGLEYQFGF